MPYIFRIKEGNINGKKIVLLPVVLVVVVVSVVVVRVVPFVTATPVVVS